MRLLKYFSHSNLDEQTNIFRCLNIKLVKEEDAASLDSIEHVKAKYGLNEDVISLVEPLNSRLKNYYRGHYKFGFTMDEGISLKRVKIPPKIESKIRILTFEQNDILSKIKRKIESM